MIARVTCLLLLFAAAPALAQSPEGPISIPGGGPAEPPPSPRPPLLQVFISPAGEPFHAESGQPYPVGQWFSRADADHDGRLTRAEFMADSLAFFDRLDLDRDKVVDGFENADYERNIAPEIRGIMPRADRVADGPPPLALPPNRTDRVTGLPGLPEPRDRPGPARREGAAQYALINEPQPVRGADADLDQRVSRAEAEVAARRRFAFLDPDGDGAVLLADLPATPAQTALERPPETRRRKAPPKRVEMQLQPPAVNAIEVSASVVDSSPGTP